MTSRAKVHRKMGYWIVVLDCSNTFSTIQLDPSAESPSLVSVGVRVAVQKGGVVVGIPIGTAVYAYVEEHATYHVSSTSLKGLTRMFTRMPDEKAAMLVVKRTFPARRYSRSEKSNPTSRMPRAKAPATPGFDCAGKRSGAEFSNTRYPAGRGLSNLV